MRRMMLLVAAVVVVVGAAVLLAGCGGGGTSGGRTDEAAPPVPAGEIVFTRLVAKPERGDLYVMAADGSHLRLLVRDAAEAAVSPDGRRIAFVRGRAIWLMQRDGSGQRQLTRPSTKPQWDPPRDDDPAWSPDGRTLYFARSLGGEDNLLLSIRDDGTHVVALEKGVRWWRPGDPAASPDGRLIAFAMIDSEHLGGGIIAVSPEGREVKLPFSFPLVGDISYHPTWSPDGRQLAYAHDSVNESWTRSTGLYVSRGDGSRPRRIAAAITITHRRDAQSLAGSAPAWSPDGTWIAFTGGDGISLVRPDGTSSRTLGRKGYDPAWLPPIR